MNVSLAKAHLMPPAAPSRRAVGLARRANVGTRLSWLDSGGSAWLFQEVQVLEIKMFFYKNDVNF